MHSLCLRLLSLLSGLLVVAALSRAEATTFYVQVGAPTNRTCAQAENPATPRHSINAGIACMSGGDTLEIGDGTYDELISDSGYNPGYSGTPPPSGSAGAPTVIRATTLHGATLRASNNGGGLGALIHLDQASSQYIRIERLVLDAENKAFDMLICISTWQSRFIEYIDLHCKNGQQGVTGDGHNLLFRRVWISHIGGGFDGGGECGAGAEPYPTLCHAYYFQTGAGVNGPIVLEENRLWDINGYGVHTYINGVTMRNTRIEDALAGGAISVGVTMVSYNNLIVRSGMYGLNHQGTLIGNTIYQVVGAEHPLIGRQIGCGINTSSSSTVKNNLVIAVASDGSGPLCGESGSSSLVSNNMCTASSGACLVVSPSSTFFVNPGTGNYQTHASSPAINQGVTLGAPYTTDIVGTSRTSMAPWDIGAYEFVAQAPPVATALAFQPQPSNTNVNAIITPAVQVRVLDQFGAVFASSASITLALGSNPGGGTLQGTLTRTAVNGIATFADLKITATGVGYTLVASSTGPALSPVTSSAFSITPQVPAYLSNLEDPPATTPVNTPMTPPFDVAVFDAMGQVVTTSTAAITIALLQNPAGGTLRSGAVVCPCTQNAVNGIASFADLRVDTVGTGYTFGYTSPGLQPSQSGFFALVPAPAPPTMAIKVDQFGYRSDMTKIAVLSDPQTGYNAADSYTPGATLAVRRHSDAVVVFSAAPTAWNAGATHTQSGDKAWWFDFTSVTAPGTYHLYDASNSLQSDAFVIGDTVYSQLLRATTRMFFYQRSGFAKATPFADARWVDGAAFLASNQDPGARLVTDQGNATTARDLRGGWFDAGDYNKYTTWASHALQDLLLTYEQFPTLFPDTWGLPESGNGLPDLLDEVKWELDWLLRMQQANGSVLSKVSSLLAECSSPPSADTRARFYGAASTASTASAAAAYALGSKVFTAAGQTAYGTTLRTAAENAWTWAQANPSVVFDNAGFSTANPEPNAYGRSMEVLRAAIFLYALTGTTSYRTYIDANYTAAQPIQGDYWYGFEQVIQEALLYYTTTLGATAASVTDIRASKITSIGGSEFTPAYTGATDAYRAYLKNEDYTFGSNRTKGHLGSIYLNMLQYNLDSANHATYRSAGAGYLHYLHGVNPQGLAYLTTMTSPGAERSSTEQYHCWFHDGTIYDSATLSPNGPALGFLVSGPNAAYTGNQTPPLGQPQQKSFRDWNGVGAEKSWEITAPAISSQAAYLRLLAQFTAHTTVPAPTDLSVTTFSTGHFLHGK